MQRPPSHGFLSLSDSLSGCLGPSLSHTCVLPSTTPDVREQVSNTSLLCWPSQLCPECCFPDKKVGEQPAKKLNTKFASGKLVSASSSPLGGNIAGSRSGKGTSAYIGFPFRSLPKHVDTFSGCSWSFPKSLLMLPESLPNATPPWLRLCSWPLSRTRAFRPRRRRTRFSLARRRWRVRHPSWASMSKHICMAHCGGRQTSGCSTTRGPQRCSRAQRQTSTEKPLQPKTERFTVRSRDWDVDGERTNVGRKIVSLRCERGSSSQKLKTITQHSLDVPNPSVHMFKSSTKKLCVSGPPPFALF